MTSTAGYGSNSMFDNIIKMQEYNDGRSTVQELNKANVESIKSMGQDMKLGNQLDRLRRWQEMYRAEQLNGYAKTLVEFIDEMNVLLSKV